MPQEPAATIGDRPADDAAAEATASGREAGDQAASDGQAREIPPLDEEPCYAGLSDPSYATPLYPNLTGGPGVGEVMTEPAAVAAMTEPTAASAPQASEPTKAQFRAPGLDGMRALAVLAVLAFHENLPWIPGGFLGVDMFFVLSGYLITDLLAARFGRTGRVGLRTFWQRRARRLLPALAVVLVTVTAAVTLLEPDQRAALRPALLGAVTYTSNWWQAFSHQSYFMVTGPPPPLQHLWSLAVEEQFYLLWPLIVTVILLALHTPRSRALAAWAGAGLSALVMLTLYVAGQTVDPSRVYYGTDTHASALLIGSALALTWPLAKVAAAKAKARLALDVAGVAGLAVIGWSMWHFSWQNPALYPFGLVLAAVAAGALVLAAAAPGRIGALLSLPPLRWLGVRSYGVYLWHWPVIAITTGVAVRAATSLPARAIGVLLPIVLAAASWRWLEAPILRNGLRSELKRRYEVMLRAPTALWRTRAVPRGGSRGSSPWAGTGGSRWSVLGTGAAALVAIAVAGTAGYGLIRPQSGPTLQEQIAQGARLASQSQLPPGASMPYPWWRRPSGHPLRPISYAERFRPPPRPQGWRVMAIGDSVMLASAPELAQAVPGIYINAQVSRAMIAGVVLIRQMAAEHRLRHVVIVGLGTNGPVSPFQIEQLRAAIGPSRWLILVNTFVPRPWEHEVNVTLATAASRYRNVLLVNWHDAIEHHTSLLWSDGIHPQPVGGRLYARVVRAVVLYALRTSPLPARAKPTPVYLILRGMNR